MEIKILDEQLSVSGQLNSSDITELAAQGVVTLICNRPDGEGSDQMGFEEIARAAEANHIRCHYLPVQTGAISDEDAQTFGRLLAASEGRVHAYCRSGMRSTTLWALSRSASEPFSNIVKRAQQAGYDMAGVAARIAGEGKTANTHVLGSFEVVIVGGGAGGIRSEERRVGEEG